VFVSFGRAVLAGALATVVLLASKSRLPNRRHAWSMVGVIAGVVIGFPAFTGLALRHAPSGHGAVVIGLLPAATAGWSLFRTGDRPSRRYWFFAAIGVAAVSSLAIAKSSTKDLAVGDLLLLGAVASASFGYTEGARISRDIGGWQTISWAVVFALPLTIPLALLGLGPVEAGDPKTAWFGFAYLGVVSMYLGFFAWYGGLAMGGVARVSQIQLLQPILSLTWAGLFLHERVDAFLVAVALVVFVAVFGSRRSAIAVAPRTVSSTVQPAP
jgi:drug/metabolite transporter (DMT)-like permease